MSIKIKNLHYVYNQGMPYEFEALKNINLEILDNKMTMLVGHTGSGKSTLVNHFNALLIPTSGELEINGFTVKSGEKNTNLKALRQEVGLVFQFSEYQLFEENILKDVAFGPKNFQVPEDEAIIRAKKALELVGIDASYYERSPFDLSGGQKRKVAMAGILAIDPKIIVLDEPTAGLDPASSKETMDLFKELVEKHGKTIIIITHDNDIVYRYADQVVLMKNGELVIHTDTDIFFNDDEFVRENKIELPKILAFKKALEAKGFKLDPHEKSIAKIAREVKKQL
ncbi:MAG: energy-coupling factor transporter ATPase [Erysipelotrichaceae bacterium]|nr:energy-coupling factor transporter ATPase [Erysipelotrichaceae bacterium]